MVRDSHGMAPDRTENGMSKNGGSGKTGERVLECGTAALGYVVNREFPVTAEGG